MCYFAYLASFESNRNARIKLQGQVSVCSYGVVALNKRCRMQRAASCFFTKLTLVIETPEGEKSGSSVAKYIIDPNNGILAGLSPGIHLGFRGEATMVDLGRRGILFCVTTSDSERNPNHPRNGSLAQSDFILALFTRPSQEDRLPSYLDDLLRRHPKIQIPNVHLPLLVRFRDLTDPSSVERVNPDDLSASFGPGVRISRSEFEILPPPGQSWWKRWTSPSPELPVTNAVQVVLPWLSLKNEQLEQKLTGPMWNRHGPPKAVVDQLSISSFYYPSYLRDVK